MILLDIFKQLICSYHFGNSDKLEEEKIKKKINNKNHTYTVWMSVSVNFTDTDIQNILDIFRCLKYQ